MEDVFEFEFSYELDKVASCAVLAVGRFAWL